MATRVSIIGLAKSGTSAMYSAVKASLPVPRRLMFEPKTAAELAYVTEGHDQNALTKLMYSSTNRLGYDPQRFTHNVAILRYPRDTVVSSVLFQFNRMKLLNDAENRERLIGLFKKKERDPGSVSIVTLLDAIEVGAADSFRRGFSNQLTRFSAYLDLGWHHLITFDQMRAGEFEALNGYLSLQLTPPPPLEGWIGKISRKGDSGDWKHWFCPSDIAFFKEAMEPFLLKYGFDPSWDLDEMPVIDPEHCSLYIARLADARRADPNLKDATVTDLVALRSAAEDGKINALTRLVALLTEDGSPVALQEAALYNETLGIMGMPKHATLAGRYFARNGDRARAILSFRRGVAAGGPAAHYGLAYHLLAQKDPALRDEAIAILRRGAELGDPACQQHLLKLSDTN